MNKQPAKVTRAQLQRFAVRHQMSTAEVALLRVELRKQAKAGKPQSLARALRATC